MERIMVVLNEPDSSYKHWKSLVQRYGVMGRQVHDARIVSIMMAYRIKNIVTLNESDFTRYREVQALAPKAVVARM